MNNLWGLLRLNLRSYWTNIIINKYKLTALVSNFARKSKILLFCTSFQNLNFKHISKSFERDGEIRWKELSLHHKLKFSNHFILATGLCIPLIFQTKEHLIQQNSDFDIFKVCNIGLLRKRDNKTEFVARI